MLKNKKVLVVGASGLIGKNLVKNLLDSGAFVIAADLSLDNLNSSLKSIGIKSDNENCSTSTTSSCTVSCSQLVRKCRRIPNNKEMKNLFLLLKYRTDISSM